MTTATSNDDLQALYREVILDHARTPRNFRRLDKATHSAEGINPLCGDKLRLYLRIGADNTVSEAGFEGSGCAISMASASLLTEAIANQSVTNVEACGDAFIQRLTTGAANSTSSSAVDTSKLRAFDGVREHPSRIKCATLAWQTLHAALHQQSVATTE